MQKHIVLAPNRIALFALMVSHLLKGAVDAQAAHGQGQQEEMHVVRRHNVVPRLCWHLATTLQHNRCATMQVVHLVPVQLLV